jgi:hypothetical protein
LPSGSRFANAARSTFSASSSSPSTSRRGNARAYGASAVRFLLRARPRHDVAGLTRTIALAEPILLGLGFGSQWVATIETDDPDALGATLRAIEAGSSAPRTSEDCLRERERLNAEHTKFSLAKSFENRFRHDRAGRIARAKEKDIENTLSHGTSPTF